MNNIWTSYARKYANNSTSAEHMKAICKKVCKQYEQSYDTFMQLIWHAQFIRFPYVVHIIFTCLGPRAGPRPKRGASACWIICICSCIWFSYFELNAKEPLLHYVHLTKFGGSETSLARWAAGYKGRERERDPLKGIGSRGLYRNI